MFLSESKVLQYFSCMRSFSAAPEAFAEIVKMANHNE